MKFLILMTVLLFSNLSMSSEVCDVIDALDAAQNFATNTVKDIYQDSLEFVDHDYVYTITYTSESCYFAVEIEKNHCEVIKDHSSTEWTCPKN